MKPAACVPSVSTMPGLMALTRILRRPEFAREDPRDGVDRALGPGVDGRVRRRQAGDRGTDIDDAAAFGEMLRRGLRRQQRPQHVDVEDLVELRLGDRLERREFVDAGIVDENVEAADRSRSPCR